MRWQDGKYQYKGVIKFVDSYFGGTETGKRQHCETGKTKILIASPLRRVGNPIISKYWLYQIFKFGFGEKLVQTVFSGKSAIRNDGYRSLPKKNF